MTDEPDDNGVFRTIGRGVAPEIKEHLDEVFGSEQEADAHHNPQQDRRMKRRKKPTWPDPEPLPEDVIVLPQHYARFAIEPIYFIGQNRLDFLLGNAIKYLMRAEFKHRTPAEDTLKAVRYAIMRAKWIMGDPEWSKEYRIPGLAEMLTKELTYAAK
jgi:hypothetical protein